MTAAVRIPEASEIEAAWARLDRAARLTLAKRVTEYQIPPKPFYPAAQEVLIFRLPPGEKKEQTEGGLHLPEGYWSRTPQGEQVWIDVKVKAVIPLGVLVAAGLEAQDWLHAHGIFVGDIVSFGEWEGRERDFGYDQSKTYKDEEKLQKYLQIYAKAIRGSVDAIERIEGKKPKLAMHRTVDAKSNFLHIFVPIPANIE